MTTEPQELASAGLDGLPITREALYDAVWRTPMRSLAKRLGCSDRGLAKTCERHRVPVPPRGYWAKVAAGHRVKRPPLPSLSEAEAQALRDVVTPVPSPRRPEPGSIAATIATVADSPEQRIQVREDLRGAHPVVIKTHEAFQGAWEDERGILHPDGGRDHSGALAIHVSKASVHRALRIADALVKAIEANGWSITCPAKSEGRGTGVRLLGEEVAIALEEKVKRFENPKKQRRVTKGHTYDVGRGPYVTILVDPYPRFGYEQLGQLALRVPGYGSPRLQVADGTTRRLEDRLDEFLVGVVRMAEEHRERRREHEERERLRLEEARRRQNVERQRAEEAARVSRLESDASAWRKAENIRAYVAAARAIETEATAEREEYFEWALRHADQIDPRSQSQRVPRGNTDTP